MSCNFFRASFLHIITTLIACRDMQLRCFNVKTLLNNAFKMKQMQVRQKQRPLTCLGYSPSYCSCTRFVQLTIQLQHRLQTKPTKHNFACKLSYIIFSLHYIIQILVYLLFIYFRFIFAIILHNFVNIRVVYIHQFCFASNFDGILIFVLDCTFCNQINFIHLIDLFIWIIYSLIMYLLLLLLLFLLLLLLFYILSIIFFSGGHH